MQRFPTRAPGALATLGLALALGCGEASPPPAAPPPEAAPAAAGGAPPPAAPRTPVERDDEPHLRNLRQLTSGGQNAEAYFDNPGRSLIFQSKRGDAGCDRIYRMGADGSDPRQVSVGDGRTTCGFFLPDGDIVYASTHAHGPGCLWEPDRSQGYVWPLHPEMDLWRADPDGGNARLLFQSPGYDAEATVCRRDGRVLFTSTKSGDPELYVIQPDGTGLRQLTDTPGYDGGAFFSPDCSKIVWRASRPQGEALEEFRALLARDRVRPGRLEIFVMDADGTNVVQVTDNGAANFAPYLHADNQRILFSSNLADPRGRNFDLWLVRVDGSGLERVTHNPTFDGFPMWSPDGGRLVFASNRGNRVRGETNVFVADWVD